MSRNPPEKIPSLRAAGTGKININNGASQCLKPEYQAPQTPEHVKKYRNSYKQQPGKTILHYGVANDQIDKNIRLGITDKSSDHVKDCFQGKANDDIQNLIADIKESKYDSRIKEPLGEPIKRNYKLPEECKTNEFRYGVQTQANEVSTKEVICPKVQLEVDEQIQKQYLKSHGNYTAGQQKERGYNWPFNPKEQRFGKAEKDVDLNQMNKVLHQEALKNEYPETVILTKKQEDIKNFQQDHLGKPKNLGQVNQYTANETIYGQVKIKEPQWSVGQCIKGEPQVKDVKPDINLGKTNKFGFRNITKPGDETRVFGVPTIRDDISKPKMKSIADPNNYGDEKPSIQLLNPQKYEFMGITSEDFNKKRTKQEIRSIFEKIGKVYKDGKFYGIYNRALEINQSEEGLVSINAFSQAVQEMDHIQ